MSEADHGKMQVHLVHQLLAISAETVVSGPTCRPAAVVLWSRIGKPFTIADACGRPVWSGNAAIVAPHFVRALRAERCHIISMNFDSSHPWAGSLSGTVGEKGVRPIDYRHVRAFSGDLQKAISGTNGADLYDLAMELAASLTQSKETLRGIDCRVEAVLDLLDQDPCATPSVHTLADEVRLSAGRLSHLLAAELGMPYRSYVLWRKFRRALSLLHERQTLCWVAQSAGFYDQAHMTRTFVGYFGLPPTAVREQGLILGHP